MLESIFSHSGLRVAIPTTTTRLDQRDRAVLELAGRVALGAQVGQLLELERALERHREADVAPEEEEVAGAGQLGRHVVDVARPRQAPGHQAGQDHHGVDGLVDLGRGRVPRSWAR